MEETLVVAKTLFEMYNERFHHNMDEMKTHKLMYFTQRESLIVNDSKLFSEDFLGWKYGPVLISVREAFRHNPLFRDINGTVTEATHELLKSVLDRFGNISSWNLSIMSHEELSWKLSRSGLDVSENGTAFLSIDAMRLDAARELALRNITSC